MAQRRSLSRVRHREHVRDETRRRLHASRSTLRQRIVRISTARQNDQRAMRELRAAGRRRLRRADRWRGSRGCSAWRGRARSATARARGMLRIGNAKPLSWTSGMLDEHRLLHRLGGGRGSGREDQPERQREAARRTTEIADEEQRAAVRPDVHAAARGASTISTTSNANTAPERQQLAEQDLERASPA